MSSSLLVTGLDRATLDEVCRLLRARGYDPIVNEAAAAYEAPTEIPTDDEHPVEWAAREAAAQALEDAVQRDERLWREARAREESRLARYAQKPRPRKPSDDEDARSDERSSDELRPESVHRIWTLTRTADYFAVLGVDPGADESAIEDAHRALSARLSLERWAHDPDLLRRAEEALGVIDEAKAVLMTPSLRAAYRAHLDPTR